MRRTLLPHRNRRSMATIWRFVFGLLVIGGFAALWPGHSFASSIAVLCVALSAACVFSAIVFREPFHGSELTRWDEAIALLAIALLVHLMF